MRLLVAHDHRFHHGPKGELYTRGSFPAAVWDRYLDHFDEVTVVARDGGPLPPGASLSRSDRDHVSFEFLPSLASLGQLLFRSPDLEKRMRSAVEGVDAVVARLPSEIGLLAVRHARALGKPYAVEVVGCAWDGYWNNGALAARLYAPVVFMRTRSAIASAPFALYVTSSWLQQRYPSSGEQVSASNVALMPLTGDDLKRREARLAALAGGQAPVIGTIASLHTQSKGIQTALGALADLHRGGLDLTYRVLGPGPIEPWRDLAARLGVSHLVQFDGTREAGEEVSRWLDQIDIHLQPSFQEGLPRATIEAMSRGVACIGSTCGGLPELLPPERLHKPGDVATLGRHLRALATNPAAIAEASRRDREVAGHHSPGALQARRSDFYAKLHERALAARRAG